MTTARAVRSAVLLLLVAASAWAGVVPPSGGTSARTSTTLWYVGDIHWNRPVGDQWAGVLRFQQLRDTVNARASEVGAMVLGGDYPWYADGTTEDTLIAAFRQFNVPVIPAIGNHEYAVGDTGTGRLYDDFGSHFPELYAPYHSPTNRGRRWSITRLPNTNVVVITLNNIRDITTGNRNYYVNNPIDGSAYAANDFDGISDSTSAQRADLKAAIRSFVRQEDWVVVLAHRTYHGIALISTRPDQEGAHTNADDCPVTWLDDNLNKNWILLEADRHENKGMRVHGKHYVFSACADPRTENTTDINTWSSYLFMFAMGDSVWDESGVLIDSLGVDENLQPTTASGTGNTWGIFWEFELTGRNGVARAWLFQNFGDEATVVDTLEITQSR